MSEAQRRPKCLGLLGWMLGHRYHSVLGDHFRHCTRCGLPVGCAS